MIFFVYLANWELKTVYRFVNDNFQSTAIVNTKVFIASTTSVYNLPITQPQIHFANEIGVHNKFRRWFVDLNNADGLQLLTWSLLHQIGIRCTMAFDSKVNAIREDVKFVESY